MIRRLLRFILVTYALVVVVLGFVQRQLLYHPRRAPQMAVAQYPDIMRDFPESQDVSIPCEDGITIRGWLLQQRPQTGNGSTETGRPLILFFHGNAGNRANRIPWYQMFAAAEADVLAIDYHGYGDSEGSISQTTLELDCDATVRYAVEDLGYEPHDVLVVGNSLGGAAAVYTVSRQCEAERSPAALLTVATFSNMVDVAGSIYWWVPVRAMLVDRYPSDQRIPIVDCPVVGLHGEEDALVHLKFGRKLFDAAPDKCINGTPKVWVSMPNVTHNNLVTTGRPFIQEQLNTLTSRWRSQR